MYLNLNLKLSLYGFKFFKKILALVKSLLRILDLIKEKIHQTGKSPSLIYFDLKEKIFFIDLSGLSKFSLSILMKPKIPGNFTKSSLSFEHFYPSIIIFPCN